LAFSVVEIDQGWLAFPSSCPDPFFKTVAGMPLRLAEKHNSIVAENMPQARFKDGVKRRVVHDI